MRSRTRRRHEPRSHKLPTHSETHWINLSHIGFKGGRRSPGDVWPRAGNASVNTFDARKLDALLTTAWSGAIAEHDGSSKPTDAADSLQEEDAVHRARVAHARATQVSKLGEMAASIVHEINQPLSAIRLNGETGLRW